MKTKQFTDEEVMEWARRHDVAHSLPISDLRMMVDDAASMHLLRKEDNRPPMTETPTPRTDAGTCLYCQKPIANEYEWESIPGGEGEHLCWGECPDRDDVDALLKQARADLQHLARVAGEALDGMIKVARADDWHEASTGRHILLRDAEAALSEIQRIKEQP